MQISLKGTSTLSAWAESIGLLSGTTLSKQAVYDRITVGCRTFIKKLLEYSLLSIYSNGGNNELFKSFGKVLVQDSTKLVLPDGLKKDFPGDCMSGKRRAVARIQTIFNLKNYSFLYFSLRSFTKNDQGASKDILPYINSGDLVIRDLGYFAIKIFKQIQAKGAYFLSRKFYLSKLYDIESLQELDLNKLLRKKEYVDTQVFLGRDKQLKVRLVAVKLSAQQAEQRKRKARLSRDMRLNHSPGYYKLLEYSIYITNVDKSIWSIEQMVQAYALRWQIEIIFKSWKTNMQIQKSLERPCYHKVRVECIIYLLLLFITLFQTYWYPYFERHVYAKWQKRVSMLKFMGFLTRNLDKIIKEEMTINKLIFFIAKYCTYESRKDRMNIIEKYYSCNS